MSISRLQNLKSSRSDKPPAVIIHGNNGMGKSTLAAEFPNPVYLSTRGESTPDDVDLPSLGLVESWKDVSEMIDALLGEGHEFQTLIVDTADGLEPVVWGETCRRNKWSSVEDPGYGKGYVAADEVWSELIAGFEELRIGRGMCIVLIVHSKVSSHEEPGSQPYKRYDLNLHTRADHLIRNWSDYIFFVNTKVSIKETEAGFNKRNAHAEGGGTRWIYTDARPGFVAKNRCTAIPDQILYKKGQGFEALSPYLFGRGAATKQSEAAE